MKINNSSLMGIRKYREVFIHLLMLAALFQALLPMLLQPAVLLNAAGDTVVVCTLQGFHAVDSEKTSSTASNNVCPVCALSHAGAAPLPAQPPQLVVNRVQLTSEPPPRQSAPRSAPYHLQARPRAPPAA